MHLVSVFVSISVYVSVSVFVFVFVCDFVPVQSNEDADGGRPQVALWLVAPPPHWAARS